MRDNNLYVDSEISGFRKGYRIYVAVFAVIILGLLTFLWIKMSSYQKKIDEELTVQVDESVSDITTEDSERAAQKCFSDFADSLTLDGWVDMYYKSHPSCFDSRIDVESLITEKILNGNIERYKAADYTLEEPKYLFVSEGEPLAFVTLLGSGVDYSINDYGMFIGGNAGAVVTAPTDCVLKINGADLVEEYAEVEKATVLVDGYEDALTNPVIMNTYTVSGLLNEESEVTAENAYLCVDGNFYDTCDDSNGFLDKAQSFIKALLHYYASGKENTDANASEVLSHVASGSKASSIINSAKSGLEWVPADYSVTYNLESSPVCRVADNCYFVDVAYTPLEEEKIDKGSGVYRVYFLDDGNGYKIVLFEGIK